jgi:hypothetical protein
MEVTRNDPSIDLSAIYKNYPLSANTTRVLRLLPPIFPDLSDVISCQLSVISLDNPPEYRALSYVWGDPSETKIILVDNAAFRVRINLWNFLAQMRAERYWDALWIDAICINQDNLQERCDQVSIMGQIYLTAADARAWLGAGTETYLLAMQRLADTNWPTCDQILDRNRPSLLNEPFATDEWLAPVLDLLNHEYWSRIWIIQEYSLATNLMVQYESVVVPTATLENFLIWITVSKNDPRDRSHDLDSDQENIITASLSAACVESLLDSPAYHIIFIKDLAVTCGIHEALAFLLVRSKRSKCTALHDGVYALLSLSGVLSANIVPDYTKSILQIFLEVTAIFREGYKAADNAFTRRVIFLAVKSLPERLQLAVECVEVQEVLDYFTTLTQDDGTY